MDLNNLAKGNRQNESLILEEIKKVIESGEFFSDRLVEKFEDKLKKYTGVDHCISCSSGTDALLISLLAFGIGPGDEVIIPDFSFITPGSLVKLIGATPIFVDVDPITFNIDPHSFKSAITENTKAVIAVSSFGQISDLDEIIEISNNEGIFVIEEGSQSFGAERNGRKSGSIANCSTTCFAPSNTLGAYGKAGAIFTRDEKLAEKIKSIRNLGLGSNSHYYNLGIDGRDGIITSCCFKCKNR
jgi:UDP-2-acetamido-2-deoxy-ribo-hexuluronate aminotransferase